MLMSVCAERISLCTEHNCGFQITFSDGLWFTSRVFCVFFLRLTNCLNIAKKLFRYCFVIARMRRQVVKISTREVNLRYYNMLLCRNALCYWMDKEEVNLRYYNMLLCRNALFYWMDKEEVNLRYYNMLLCRNALCYWTHYNVERTIVLNTRLC